MFDEPPGYVSPYPEFYRQLGQLARQAAAVLAQVTPEPDFAAAGQEWLKRRQQPAQEPLSENYEVFADWVRALQESNDAAARIAQAMAKYFEELGQDIEAANTLDRARAWEALDAAARRCVEGKGVTDRDRRCMAAFLRSPEGNAAQLLPEFAELCEKLATIADKELAGQPLDRNEARLIGYYGETLARFHFYGGVTWMDPRDDFPCVAPVFNSPLRQKALHVGVGRPEAIYVVLDNGKRLALHRGAVLSYREFPLPLGEELDDQQWREEVSMCRAPSPPVWTASFRTTASRLQKENIRREAAVRLRESERDTEDVSMTGHQAVQVLIERLLEEWEARPFSTECYRLLQTVLAHAVDESVPDLLDKVLPVAPENDIREISTCLQDLNWHPHRAKLLALMHHSRPRVAFGAAYVLGDSPEDINVSTLVSKYARQAPHLRAVYCYLIGRSRQPGPEGERVLAAGLRDESWQVRRQAAAAVSACRATSDEILAGVRRGLDDKDPKVASAMVRAAAALGLKDTAPQMLARLDRELQTPADGDVDERGSSLSLEDPPIEWLTEELIAGLGKLRYQPARDVLRGLIFPDSRSRPTDTTYATSVSGLAAFGALLEIEPQERQQLISDILKDPGSPYYMRELARAEAALEIEPQEKQQSISDVFQDPRSRHYMRELARAEAALTIDLDYVKTMLPVFEDLARTPANDSQSQAVQAAREISRILEQAIPRDPEAAELFEKIRAALLRQTRGSAAARALSALKHFDPALAARECLSVALDKKMDKGDRTHAVVILKEAPKPWPIRELLPLVDEAPDDEYTFPGVSYSHSAAETVGLLSARLDPAIPQEAETLRLVQGKFTAMLKGPCGERAVTWLSHISDDPPNLLLGIALDRSLPYATRASAISNVYSRSGPEYAKKLVPLLNENTRPDDEQPTIALCAANAIAFMLDEESWNGEESTGEFVRKARIWAEGVESK